VTLEARPSDFRCDECSCEITIEQYRRKVPRCDDCEVDALLQAVRELESGPTA
jgi:Zn finger protein HypA/HybF involved in hydrogenase expression